MKRFALPFWILLSAPAAFAQQPATGFPPYGSFQRGDFDAVNLQNLNVNFSIPIVSSPGRGVDLNLSLAYNSLVWTVNAGVWSPVVNSTGQPTWGWIRDDPVGRASFTTSSYRCVGSDLLNHTVYRYQNYRFVDPRGTPHSFNLVVDYDPLPTRDPDCPGAPQPTGAYATDASGYYLQIPSQGPAYPKVYRPTGIGLEQSGPLKDTNGNYISSSSPVSGETDWMDTRGVVALKVITGATSVQYQYLDTGGAYQTITLNLALFSVRTSFGCPAVTDYNLSGTMPQATLPYELVFPNGKKFQFAYEPTPLSSGFVTGRMAQVTLPGGGTYQYQYGDATNNYGINCSDGTGVSMTRTISEAANSSTWTYVRVPLSQTTTVTAPTMPYDAASNQTVFTFDSSAHETSQKIYQGSATGTPLRTVNTTWGANGPASRVTILEDGTTQSKTETSFDSNGNLLSLKEYDWGSSTSMPLLRTTTFTYVTDPNYTSTSRNLLNLLATKTIQDSLGTIQYRQDIRYDETPRSPCPTGAVQHDDTGYPCGFMYRGNPTSVITYKDPVTPANAVTKVSTYDIFGNLVTAALNCCQQKTFNYSSATSYAFPDSVISGSAPPQLTTSATYNAYTGQIATTTNENNGQASFTYSDPGHLNRLTDIQRPDTQHVTYAYDDTARTVTVTSPIQTGASIKQVSYFDGLRRPVKQQVTDNGGASYSIAESQYDGLGRPFRASNPHNSSAQYWNETDFDALGRPTATKVLTSTYTVTPGNTTTYLYAGQAVTVTDPAGKQKKSVVDGLGRLVTVYEPDVANGNNLTQSTAYSYNPLDELLTATQGIQTRTYTYDALGRLLSSTTPESGRTCFGTVSGSTCNADGYDSFDNLKYRTDARGVLTNYGYDTLNRLSQISYNVGSTGVPATPTVTYTYGIDSSCNTAHGTGCIGRLITMTDGVGSENYTYDILGRTLQLQKTINGTSYPMNYTYNYVGEMTSIQYPSVTRTVQSSYDAIGRLCSVGTSGSTCTTGANYANGFGYNPAGQVTGFNYANGVSATLGYTADRLLLQTLSYTKGATTLLNLSYGYTQNGGNNSQITSITDNTGTQEAGRSVTYAYDALYRLTSASTTGSTGYPNWHLTWGYDRYGNRLNQTVQTDTSPNLQPPPPSNSLSFASPSGGALTNRQDNMCFDANGNLLAESSAPCPSPTYVYDAENRMVNYSSAAYTYDGNGLRVKKVSGSTTTVYIFSGSKVIAEYDNGAAVGSPSREYLYSGGALLAKIEGGATSYYHPDHLSTRVLTDSSGTSVGSRGHYPYGETWYESGTTTKLKFTSYERDSESTNDFALARYHINRFGRFSSPDLMTGSIPDPQSLNRFTYTLNEPTNLVDPLGLNVVAIVNCYIDDSFGSSGEGSVTTFGGWFCWGYGAGPAGPLGDPGGGIGLAKSLLSGIAAGNFKSKDKCRKFLEALIKQNGLNITVDALVARISFTASDAANYVYDGPTATSVPLTPSSFPDVGSSGMKTVADVFSSSNPNHTDSLSQFDGSAIWIRSGDWGASFLNSYNGSYGSGTLMHEVLHKNSVGGGFTHGQMQNALDAIGMNPGDYALGRNRISDQLGRICF